MGPNLSCNPIRSIKIRFFAEPRKQAQDGDEVSCHSESDSSQVSEFELEALFYNQNMGRQMSYPFPVEAGHLAVTHSASQRRGGYDLVRSDEELQDLATFGKQDATFLDCMSRCAQLSSELRVLQANLESNVHFLLNKLQEERGPLTPDDRGDGNRARPVREEDARMEETPGLLLSGRQGSSLPSAPGGDDSDRSSCLGQILDPGERRFATDPI